MRSVLATKFLPLPAHSGGHLRTQAFVERLAARGPLTVCGFDDGRCDAAALERMGIEVRSVPWPLSKGDTALGVARSRSLTAGRFHSAALARAVREACADDPDVLVVGYSQLGYLLDAGRAATKVLDLHNVEADLVASYGRARGGAVGVAARVEAVALSRVEARAIAAADLVTVVSETDEQRLGPEAAGAIVCRNGWEPRSVPSPATEPVVAFVALMSWRPNVDAACWLGTEVWPLVRAKVPGAKLVLVGREPAPEVRALAADDIEVTGTVDDVWPWLGRARVAVAPLRAGGGSRLKIIEALGAGRPVVATSVGAEGLEDLLGRGVVTADAADRFAEEVVDLLEDPARAESLGLAGRSAVEEAYSWDATLAPLFDRLPR